MSNIYEQHDKAFNRVAAYVIARNGERVATIAFKFPAGGRLYAYVHWHDLEMVRGMAGGYGYDKRSAACADAMRKLLELYRSQTDDVTPDTDTMARAEFIKALAHDGGQTWDSMLSDAGFTVWQAV